MNKGFSTRVFLEMAKLSNLNSGLGQFCYHLGNAIAHINDPEIEPVFFVPPHTKNLFGNHFEYRKARFLNKFLPLKSSDITVWHCLHQDSYYLPAHSSTKLILTIHDLNFLEKNYADWRKTYRLRELQKKVNKASAITVISNYTAEIVKQHLKIPSIPFKVIYNGNTLQAFTQAQRPAFMPEGGFIFSIGIINPRKNFQVLLRLLENQPDLTLVIAGTQTARYTESIMQEAHERRVATRIILPGNVSQEEKYWLYSNCKAFVFPSVSEGFGLPVIEAMSLGKPVFLSDKTCLPEIGGLEAFYWHNFEAEHMMAVFEQGMKEYENDPLKKERIKNWAAQFTWTNAAKAYIELYKQLK